MHQPRIVTWRAVSSEEQARDEKESLHYQELLNRQHVAKWNGVVIAELEVPGMTRNIILWEKACRDIPAFAKLNDLIERKAFDILMCMDVTRLARTSSLLAAVAGLCEAAGIRIYETSSPPGNIDGPIATFDSRLITLLKGGMSEQEVRKMSERMIFGRQAQVRKGKHANNLPAGLKRVYDAQGNAVTVLDEAWRPYIEMFFDLYLEHGRSQHAIANEFNARGMLYPGRNTRWDEHTITTFLRNAWAYAGYVTWGKWAKKHKASFRVKAEWGAFITEEQVRRSEEEKSRRSRTPKSIGNPQRFSVLAKCGRCGGTLTVSGVAGTTIGTKRVQHLKTTRYRCRNYCRGSDVREAVLYEAICAAIVALQDDERLSELAGEIPSQIDDLATHLADAHKALAQVAKERGNLTLAFMREAIRLDEYEPMMAELKARYEAIAATVTKLEDQQARNPTPGKRRNELEQVRDRGLAMLNDPDMMTANAWLRRHFALLVENGAVISMTIS